MTIPEKLTFGQTYVVQSDGPIKITQTGAHGTLVKVNVTDEDGTAGREVVFTAIDTAATVEVDKDTNWSCVPGFNRGAASVQGGPTELTTDQKTFLQWVTDGKLYFDTDGRLKIATSVDATGTFNHDGYASNYTKTIGSTKYTTTVNATEVIVKKSVAGVETVLMHLHDGALELGGARVLTAGDAYDLRRREQLVYSAATDGEVIDRLEHDIIGDDAEYILPNVTLTYQTRSKIYSATANGMIAAPAGVKKMHMRFKKFQQLNSVDLHIHRSNDTDFVIEDTEGLALTNRERTKTDAFGFKSLTYILKDTALTGFTLTWGLRTDDYLNNGTSCTRDIFFSAPRATTLNSTAFDLSVRFDNKTAIANCPKLSNMRVELPSLTSSFSFYGPLARAAIAGGLAPHYTDPLSQELMGGIRIQKDVLMHLWAHLPSASDGATITTCVDSALAHVEETTQELVFDDPDLAAAAESVQQKGWALNITPIS